MANSYWNFLTPIARFTLGRAEAMNALFAGISSGFDKIPDIGEFVNNSGDYADATGTGDPYVITLKPEQITSYTAGLRLRFKANVANPGGGGAINLNGIGAKSLLSSSGGALPAGTIPSGSIVDVSYDGTAFRLAVQSPSAIHALLAGATFTGDVLVPTSSIASDTLKAANVTMLRSAVAALVASSPAALDTLDELAAALGDDANFATTVTNALALKAPLASPALTGNPTAPTQAAKNNTTRLATTAFVQGEKGYTAGVTTLTASTTLTSAHLGSLVVCNAAGATTMTLPDAATYSQGILSLVNINTGLVTLSGSIIYDGATVTSLTVPTGGAIDLVSNGTSWVAAQQTLSSAIPAGAVMGFDLGAPPSGWIAGNGAAISRAAYARLDAAMYCGDANNATATAWYRCTNPADPSTTRSTTGAYIVTRDLRGVFIRYLDDGKGYDTGRVVGSYQADDFKSHTHPITRSSAVGGAGTTIAHTLSSSATTNEVSGATGGTETRPKNVALLGCIKY